MPSWHVARVHRRYLGQSVSEAHGKQPWYGQSKPDKEAEVLDRAAATARQNRKARTRQEDRSVL